MSSRVRSPRKITLVGRRRRAPRVIPPETGTNPSPGLVEVRIPGARFVLNSDASSRLAFYWSYVVRSRGRWQADPELRRKLVEQATNRFAEIGLGPDALRQIAQAGVVEVATPYDDSGLGWAPRILPWEFLLSETTHSLRKHPLCVVRHLWSNHPRPKPKAPARLLFVENAAGGIGEIYSFADEREWMQFQLGIKHAPLANPTPNRLADRIARYAPDVIHLSGVDWHQGARLGLAEEPPPELDGLLMAGRDRQLLIVDQNELADCLNPPGYPGARLVVLNTHNSAARLAAAAVAQGAHAAIGFQDEIADDAAEQFIASFYGQWRAAKWDLLAAFRATFDALGATVALSGTGVVLWSSTSLMSTGAAAPTRSSRTSPLSKAKSGSLRDQLGVRIQPPLAINYSMLHGGARLFRSFTVYRRATGPVPPIEIEVTLRAGADSFPYQASVSMPDDDKPLRLASRIHLPLTSSVLRALRETVRTGLYVRVTCGSVELVRETYMVLLCPIDEWRWDEEDDARWLAAFVLPRDSAVLRIIDLAQKYLLALQDDSTAGFDGYQSIDESLEDPEAGVEMQVRAIWSALAFELPIAYVNPPPVFSEASQRLRSPSDVVDGKRGTCIDLALMLAACLEYIEIHPVVFVLKDHAFPGFWRSESAYDAYFSFDVDEPLVSSTTSSEDTGSDSASSRFTEYDDVLRHVRAGRLVPLETVFLTRRLSFREAIEQGMENLKDRRNFGRLLDVGQQRKLITPLPVLRGES